MDKSCKFRVRKRLPQFSFPVLRVLGLPIPVAACKSFALCCVRKRLPQFSFPRLLVLVLRIPVAVFGLASLSPLLLSKIIGPKLSFFSEICFSRQHKRIPTNFINYLNFLVTMDASHDGGGDLPDDGARKKHRRDNSAASQNSFSSFASMASDASEAIATNCTKLIAYGVKHFEALKPKVPQAANVKAVISCVFKNMTAPDKEWNLAIASMTPKGYENMDSKLVAEMHQNDKRIESETKREKELRVELENAKARESVARVASFKASQDHVQASTDLHDIKIDAEETLASLMEAYKKRGALVYIKMLVDFLGSDTEQPLKNVAMEELRKQLGILSVHDLLGLKTETIHKLNLAFKNFGLEGNLELLAIFQKNSTNPDWVAIVGGGIPNIFTGRVRSKGDYAKRLQMQRCAAYLGLDPFLVPEVSEWPEEKAASASSAASAPPSYVGGGGSEVPSRLDDIPEEALEEELNRRRALKRKL